VCESQYFLLFSIELRRIAFVWAGMSEQVEERHSDDEYLDAVREHEPAAPSEIAEIVGVARQSAYYRLRKLEDKQKVASKKIGNSLAWSLGEESVESVTSTLRTGSATPRLTRAKP
jgi:predicted transcriptional regulator